MPESAGTRILESYQDFKDEKSFSKVVKFDTLKENQFNLNIRRYVDTTPPPLELDLGEVLFGKTAESTLHSESIHDQQESLRYKSEHQFSENSLSGSIYQRNKEEQYLVEMLPGFATEGLSKAQKDAVPKKIVGFYAGEGVRFQRLKVSEFLEQRKEKGAKGLPIYSVTINEGMVPRDEIGKVILSDLDSGDNLIARKGDFCYNMMRMWQGSSGIAPEDCLVSPAYVVCSCKENVKPEYISYLMKTDASLKYLARYSQGIAQDKWRLYFENFSTMRFPIPPIETQEKIVGCLSQIHDARSALEKQSNALKRLYKVLSDEALLVRSMSELWD